MIAETTDRKWLVRATIVILVIATIEGAVRKWILDGPLGQSLILIRDGITIFIIIKGFYCGLLRKEAPELFMCIWTLFVVGWGAIQLSAANNPMWVYALGLRGWLLYAWAAFVMWRGFTILEVRSICATFLLLVPPLAVLAVIQQQLPPGHILNKQISGDETQVMVVAHNIVRTTGTFSFTTGFYTFCSLAIAITLGFLSDGTSFIKKIPGWVFVISAMTMVVVSGSRSAWALSGIITALWLIGMWRHGKLSLHKFFVLIISAILIIAGGVWIFQDALVAMTERVESASAVENPFERIFSTLFGSIEVWDYFNPIGAGLGMGNNAVNIIMQYDGFLLAEGETEKMLLEAGYLGLLFVTIKFTLAANGLRLALSQRTYASILPVTLWTFAAYHLTLAQLTAQLTTHAFGWIGIGIAAASLKSPYSSDEPKAQD